MSTANCSTVACRMSLWWSGLPKVKQDLIILIAGLALIGAIALVGGSFGKHGVQAWTWHIGG